ncbi:MAG: restriction endonuclease [Anaerolineaceae bacterium]|jgi:hypothetical protein|nr:restriction endonuclease [Anaerolineaceae bacterium]
MQFKDAAFEVLKKEGKPLHYQEIASRALALGILETEGETPGSTMGALLYTDTLKADSRFIRGEVKGTFTLKTSTSGTIQGQITKVQSEFKKNLRELLLKLHPGKFEVLIRLLLEEMGFEETLTTLYSNDKGVDVRGVLRSNALSEVKVAIQAKRWTGNVGSGVVRDLRGSLKVADSEQGLIITPSDFSPSAREESQALGKTPIRLINGNQLVDLLIQYNVGVKNIEYVIPTIDSDYWTEVLGITPETGKVEKPKIETMPTKDTFPIQIQASHNGVQYQAELINLDGLIRFNGTEYQTPTTAAKVIVTDWKSVNGWAFWLYNDKKTGELVKISQLRKH